MSTILLQSNCVLHNTMVPNLFIDKFMPSANGAYVKIYLYLLRSMNNNTEKELVISSIADHLDNTEKDIIRALYYWEKVNLITLIRDKEDNIISILLNDIASVNTKESNQAKEIATTLNITEETSENREEENATLTKEHSQAKFEKPTYSDAQIQQLTESDEVKWLLNIIEIYLDRLIKPMDLQLILYMYESLNFSAELILYLYEYCIAKDKKNPSYIEAVALSWAEEGIDTLEKAEESTTLYNSNYNAIKKAFGLNRGPGQIEKKYINKWLNQYNFPIEIIVEACNRTIIRTQKPDFNYADKILESWFKKGVKNLNQITLLDEEHKKKTSKPKVTNYGKNPKSSATNRFNAFPQRNYTTEDYSSLEQRLLHKK